MIALVLMTVFNQFSARQATQKAMEYSQFIEEVKPGRIAKVTIEGGWSKASSPPAKIQELRAADIWMVTDCSRRVIVEAKPEEEPSLLMNIFVSWFRCVADRRWISSCARCRVAARRRILLRQEPRAHARRIQQAYHHLRRRGGLRGTKEEVGEWRVFCATHQVQKLADASRAGF